MPTARSILALLLLASLPACQAKPPDAITITPSSSSTSEADKARELQQKAADLDRRAEELKTKDMTDQERIDAANQIEKERQALADQQAGGH